jgi:hypothetical protein
MHTINRRSGSDALREKGVVEALAAITDTDSGAGGSVADRLKKMKALEAATEAELEQQKRQQEAAAASELTAHGGGVAARLKRLKVLPLLPLLWTTLLCGVSYCCVLSRCTGLM